MGAHYEELSGRSALVTGGATGIGEAVVRAFAAQGARVAFLDIDAEAGGALAAASGAAFHRCDVTDIDALREAIAAVAAAQGPVDILVNNAADDARHDLETTTPAQWDHGLAVNLRPHFFAAQACAPAMRARRRGAVINMTSNSYLLGLTGYPGYIAAKAAIAGLTKTLARTLGPDGVRVNAIAPGWVMTEKQRRLWLTPDASAELMRAQALKAEIAPDDIARACLFLASDDARMITGQVLVVDGGRT
jgi:NAD(P)-dependent dehydrogenase (short-subunit alcohol dehydrogenase family)